MLNHQIKNLSKQKNLTKKFGDFIATDNIDFEM